MEGYTLQTWILLFFTYSFLGWIWECCYVSANERKWVNRGFLYGPMLPIYGFGALVVLFSTIHVRDNLYLVFILGTFGATILELVTGYVMEILFKTRYWDYSRKRYHYKGYICLSSTIAWGFFSIIMVEYINIPVENFILGLNNVIAELAVLILLVVFTVDATKSVQNALDLRQLLETMANNNEHVNNLVKDMEELTEIFENKGHVVEELKEELAEHIKMFEEEVKNREHISFEKITNARDNLDLRMRLSNRFERVTEMLNKINENANNFEDNENEGQFNDIKIILTKLNNSKDDFENVEFKRFKGAIKQLKRNKTAKSIKLKEELEKLRNL